ncbi:pseudouridine synthase [Portibacter lacus]|uniref:Pseudouridine synthase n=1 Tax=Portibacter lacus TaxID=1099794 RepID=A0AA37WC64_9BACT|nr:pseudouridine synthase [Portibacter lacus]GLR16181.1 pseudouridine synthase [Portibacter lacus]
MYKTYKIYKPFGVLSQFTKEHESHQVLGDLFDFPKDVYPIGRLDKDSEGLLLLSNDKSLTDKLLNPKHKLAKTYWVQVEGSLTEEALQQLSAGVTIKVKTGKYHDTLPCEVSIIDAPLIPERDPPIRERKTVPTTWASITISEGKNRQVRKMFAKVGFPVLRLVRYAIGETSIDGMDVGEVVSV